MIHDSDVLDLCKSVLANLLDDGRMGLLRRGLETHKALGNATQAPNTLTMHVARPEPWERHSHLDPSSRVRVLSSLPSSLGGSALLPPQRNPGVLHASSSLERMAQPAGKGKGWAEASRLFLLATLHSAVCSMHSALCTLQGGRVPQLLATKSA